MRSIFALSLLCILAACGTPRNIAYCQANGAIPQTQDWNNCLQYFAQNEAVFQRDVNDCAFQADAYYPRSLYDNGHYETYRRIGYDGWPRHEHVFVPGDYYRNAQLDSLRLRIIEPCMQSKGWNTARGWEYGRLPTPQPKRR